MKNQLLQVRVLVSNANCCWMYKRAQIGCCIANSSIVFHLFSSVIIYIYIYTSLTGFFPTILTRGKKKEIKWILKIKVFPSWEYFYKP